MSRRSNRVFFAIQGFIKYLPFSWAAHLRPMIYRPFFAAMGENVRILDGVTIKYPDEIRLGNDVTINEGCYIVGLGGLTMGNDVMVGAGTKIVTTSHASERTDGPADAPAGPDNPARGARR
jgi:acetyltransferase-like isoleucine patch superfamily enzyme